MKKPKKDHHNRILSWGFAVVTILGLAGFIVDECTNVGGKVRKFRDSMRQQPEQVSPVSFDRGQVGAGIAPFLAEQCASCHRPPHVHHPDLVAKPDAAKSSGIPSSP